MKVNKLLNCYIVKLLKRKQCINVAINQCERGFSVLEVILAAAIFVTFATAAVVVVISGIDNNRLGGEMTVANQFNTEGMEAVKSIKNQSFSNISGLIPEYCTSGAGVTISGGVWTLKGLGTSDSLDSRYNRIIKVCDAQRLNGNIVTSGGTNDPDTKKVTVTTNWNFTSARPESVEFTDYLTNWRAGIIDDGIIVYGDTTSVAQPKYRTYSNNANSFSSEFTTGTSFNDSPNVGKTFKIKTSPTKIEAIAGYVNNIGVLRILCFDGDNRSSEWTSLPNVGGNGTNSQRFGIAYETSSGDVMVIYSTGAAGNNAMSYRTKPGTTGCGQESNWTTAATFPNSSTTPSLPNLTTGTVQWIRIEGSPLSSSNNIGIAWNDDSGRLGAALWNGSSWFTSPASALEITLERVTTNGDVQSFDLAFESLTGNLMVVWSPLSTSANACTPGTNCMKYAKYTGSWTTTNFPTVADPSTNVDLSSNPNTNQIVMAGIDNNSADLSIAYWPGGGGSPTWSGFANQDSTTQAPLVGTKLVATGWLLAGASCPPTCTTRYVVLYNDSNQTDIQGFVGGPTFTTAPTRQNNWFNPTPAFGNPQKWYDIQMDLKNKDRLMFTLSDNTADLLAKRLVMSSTGTFTSPNGWSNSDNNSPGGGELELNLGQTTGTTAPFGFAYWRNQ